MKIDGKKIKDDILGDLKKRILNTKRKPALHIFVVGENSATESFVKIKKKIAGDIGVDFIIHKFTEDITEEFLKNKVLELQQKNTEEKNLIVDGIIIQLPLPSHVDTDNILNIISEDFDIDILSDNSRKLEYKAQAIVNNKIKNKFKSPIQKTLDKILHGEDFKTIGIVGMGKLIGQASCEYFKYLEKEIFVFEKGNSLEDLKKCDVIISGTGMPNLIKKEMIKESVILIDFGYGNIDGKLVGDIDEECFPVAKKYTTVPGGTGPIMVAYMFANLVESFERSLI